jgi:hypothetical protein
MSHWRYRSPLLENQLALEDISTIGFGLLHRTDGSSEARSEKRLDEASSHQLVEKVHPLHGSITLD